MAVERDIKKTTLTLTLANQKRGKSSRNCQTATNERQYLIDFNQSFSLAIAKTMKHLSDFVFISMAHGTLVRRDSYLDQLRSGIKQHQLNALRIVPLNMVRLFPDSVLQKVKEDIAQFEDMGYSGLSPHKNGCYHHYERPNKSSHESSWSN